MEKTSVLSIMKKDSDTIEVQGKRRDIQRYLNKGYYIKKSRNGYWVLVNPARVDVTLKNGETRQTFNMKSDICEHYGRERISDSLVKAFKKDIESGKIKLELDSDGYYSFD